MGEFKCYGISPYESNAMLSKNPHSGIYEAATARTLDLNGGKPCCHQGGVLIIKILRGAKNGGVHNGNGTSQCRNNEGGCPTLNTTAEQPIYTNDQEYIVRRLTPLECCRLQGFPDWWEDGVPGSDSARYKMWGNGMALPNMLHVMKGIKALADSENYGLENVEQVAVNGNWVDDLFGSL